LIIGCQVWTELFATVKIVQVDQNVKAAKPVLLMQTGKDTHPHPQTNKTWSISSNDFWKL
jgi:hypothetical protein